MVNEMMHRPIINPDVLSYLRTNLSETNNPKLIELRKEAQLKGFPIIPLETASFLRLLINLKKPKRILEIGTAVGYSSLLMAIESPVSVQITTIERNPVMYKKAIENITNFDRSDQIKVLFGDAKDLYEELITKKYDLVFLDGAKAKYLEQFERLLPGLNNDGLILIDDIFQGGDILKPREDIKHRHKGIHRHLNQLLDEILPQKKYISSLVPLGDGLLMVQKNLNLSK